RKLALRWTVELLGSEVAPADLLAAHERFLTIRSAGDGQRALLQAALMPPTPLPLRVAAAARLEAVVGRAAVPLLLDALEALGGERVLEEHAGARTARR